MKNRVCRHLLQLVCLALLVVAGGCLFVWRIRAVFPEREEAREMLTAAVVAEAREVTGWPVGVCTERTLFHVVAGGFARFVGEGEGPYPSRCYRVVPVIFGVLLMVGFYGLGVRRNGGIIETDDGLFWGVAFVGLLFGLVGHGVVFGPQLFEALLFLGVMVAARSYVSWPGYMSAGVFGGALAVLLSVDVRVGLLAVGFLPAVAVGAGWRRLCLYWQGTHVLLAVVVALAVGAPLVRLGLGGAGGGLDYHWMMGGWPVWREVLWRHGWLCGGGFGIVGWAVLLVWCWLRADRRWARFLVIFFPFVVVLALGMERHSALGVLLLLLSAVIMGCALSVVHRGWLRGVMGGVTVLALGVGVGWAPEGRSHHWLPREVGRENVRLLRGALETPQPWRCRMRVAGGDLVACAQLIWPMRGEVASVAWGEEVVADADILVVAEPLWEGVSPAVEQYRRPGTLLLGDGGRYRVYAPKSRQLKEES